MRDLYLPGRSAARSLNGMAATSHGLSTAAAVAACAVQCVVEPESVGIGGDCFALIKPAGSDAVVAYNGSGRAPAAATQEWYAAQGMTGQMPRFSPHAVTVPGAVEAWCRLLEDHGTWDREAVLAPAVAYARDGYPISDRVSRDWSGEAGNLARFPANGEVFLPGGAAPAMGDVHRQPQLARILERIAVEGPSAFYEGPVAAEIVAVLKSHGGLHETSDFAGAAGEYVAPLVGRFRDLEVIQCPPNGQGITALQILGILDRTAPEPDGPLSVARVHRFLEACRLAYQERDRYLADPAKVEVPVEEILGAARLDHLAGKIDMSKAMGILPTPPGAAHSDTVYITVVDRERNLCSFICSLFDNFGSCILAPESGVMLHSRGRSFSLAAGHPNAIAPGKRPLHTIIPGMAARGGKPFLSYGVMGGQYQAAGHAWFLGNLIDYGLDPQEAIDLPRIFPMPGKPVDAESGLPGELTTALSSLGHELATPKKPIGGGQAIVVDWERGTLTGGSDPRKDGAALGY